jgi:hypothetical protein
MLLCPRIFSWQENKVEDKSITTGATRGTGTAYRSVGHEFTIGFSEVRVA